MDFADVLDKVLVLLQQQGRASYRALKLRFQLDDEFLASLKEELLFAHAEHVKEEGPGLVWLGATPVQSSTFQVQSLPQPLTPSTQSPAERRQLTVLFCDLVGSTALSAQLDPEDYQAVVQHYHATCDVVIARYEGHVAQHLGDGILVYFGYPAAHEDDARRAVRTSLEIVTTVNTQCSAPLPTGSQPLQVRIGIHTGLVVVGDIGAPGRTEQLALGETPNVAARLQGLAEPNTVLLSAATHRLINRHFECQPFGSHLLKGLDTPLAVYHVQSERSHGTFTGHATPLVGREQEVGLLQERWEQVKDGRGQVVLLTGEPGIGKSRLTQTLTDQVSSEGSLALETRCSPYHQNSAFYPLIDAIQRALLFQRDDTVMAKVDKLERMLALYNMQDTLPLFAALLSLPLPDTTPSLNLTPQKQKERTIAAMVQWWLTQAERQATMAIWEDLHWADPSTLEFLTLLLEQVPTSRLFILLTARPEFVSPWPPRSHIVTLTLNRLGRRQTEAMIAQVAAGTPLLAEMLDQIRRKTDGVPLFVEELTKSVLETIGAQPAGPLQLAIPATLQDSLMARLDRLNTAKEIAQLGATLGREFSYELLRAVSQQPEETLQQGLRQLVDSELVYQRGTLPQAIYIFKHALIQDTAYQSLLRSTRVQYHQHIAQVLEDRFPETKDNQPEFLAHHYTEAVLLEQAIPYWQKAGEKAVERSAYAEAISHITKGLELLSALPDTTERTQQELTLQFALGSPLIATKGYTAQEVEKAYVRMLELSRQIGEAPQIILALWGMCVFYVSRAELGTARELAEECLIVAESVHNPTFLLLAHHVLGVAASDMGEIILGRTHLEEGTALYDPRLHHSSGFIYGQDLGVVCLCHCAITLWLLGYPDQALQKSRTALTLAQELAHPNSLAYASYFLVWLSQLRRDSKAAQEQTERLLTLCAEQGIPFFHTMGSILRGWTLMVRDQTEEGISHIQQGLIEYRGMGAGILGPHFLALLSEAYAKVGRTKEGLDLLSEALSTVNKTKERWYEAELYRLKGELLLAQAEKVRASKSAGEEHCLSSEPQDRKA